MSIQAVARNHRTSHRMRQVADLLERRIPALSWIERDDLAEEIGHMLDESYREGSEDTRDDLTDVVTDIESAAGSISRKAAWPKRLTDAEAIARIMVAGRGAEEHKRRWQNGFISEAAYNAAMETAIAEIARVLREAGR